MVDLDLVFLEAFADFEARLVGRTVGTPGTGNVFGATVTGAEDAVTAIKDIEHRSKVVRDIMRNNISSALNAKYLTWASSGHGAGGWR